METVPPDYDALRAHGTSPACLSPLFGGWSIFREAARHAETYGSSLRIIAMQASNNSCSTTEHEEIETSGREKRVNPRRRTRSLVADIETSAGARLHAISDEVSAYGASFIITDNHEGAAALRRGDIVTVSTSTSRGLRAEINAIRPASEGDLRTIIGLKLLDGRQWLSADG